MIRSRSESPVSIYDTVSVEKICRCLIQKPYFYKRDQLRGIILFPNIGDPYAVTDNDSVYDLGDDEKTADYDCEIKHEFANILPMLSICPEGPVFNKLPAHVNKLEGELVYSFDSIDQEPFKVNRFVKTVPYDWQKDIDLPNEFVINDVHNLYPMVGINSSPVEIIDKLFNDKFWNFIVEMTNLYISRRYRKYRSFGRYNYMVYMERDVTINEMKCFIGILIIVGYRCMLSGFDYNISPNYLDYWTYPEVFGHPCMAYNRFCFILKYLNFCNEPDIHRSILNDRFIKIRAFMNLVNDIFIDFMPMEFGYSIDSFKIQYDHDIDWRRDRPDLSIGYKFWYAASCENGYICWFEPYTGIPKRQSDVNFPYINEDIARRVLISFVENRLQTILKTTQFKLYLNKYFTSLPIVEWLTNGKIRVTGELYPERLNGWPYRSEKKLFHRYERGGIKYAFNGIDLLVLSWQGPRGTITLVSNCLSIKPNSIKKIKVRSCNQDEKGHYLYGTHEILQPNVVKKYQKNIKKFNKNANNAMLQSPRIRDAGKKWYFPIFIYCLEMMVHNAYVLHVTNSGTLDRQEFRHQIATSLIACNGLLTGTKNRQQHENTFSQHYLCPGDSINRVDSYETLFRYHGCNIDDSRVNSWSSKNYLFRFN